MNKKQNFFYLSLFCFLFLFVGCSTSYQIQGYVYESYQGNPLPNIPIVFDSNIEVTTNAEGAYSISSIKQNPVHVEIEGGKRWKHFQDDLLLDKGVNYRDFFLESLHPLGMLESEINEPYTIRYRIDIGNSEEDILQSAEVESIPVEQSVHIKGYEIGLDGKRSDIEIIQIGLTGWSRDVYGNWNETIDPGYSMIRFDQVFQEEMDIASSFYKDQQTQYEDTGETVQIGDEQTRLYNVEYKEEESGFTRSMKVYVLQEGPWKGQIKKIVSYHPQKSNHQYCIILIDSYNEVEAIFPPVITK
ncbi:MAG TPA: hypothetical protein PLE09_01120 [Caldisericia bacterium]|nr:hypothetical protein [Caldisericia bacterium]